ncbi:PREDICTED: stress-induced-phosphoprotein 1-like [Cyprinodon variegatus]|uniref:Stress-induced-phosphoprotein 1-like n=1 Tax=Cyprinodon variegatus TaxID=28743 RepID=A0A3Q2CIY3_CYPVA|nr:PREDICTED: stress-induced-phosphoprotein 1-like [Cyprinodon variegatus]
MPKRREIVRGGPGLPRIREGSRLMRTHETMVDYLSGRSNGGSFLEALAPSLFGFHFSPSLEKDLIYSDDDLDYDDDDDDNSHNFGSKPLKPHPQIKELGEEEANEFIEEHEKRKDKTERNKRKKKRKKEKKRLEKENAHKESLPVDNEDELDSSKVQEQACIIDNSEKIKPPDSGETETQEAGIVEVAENTKEKEILKINSTKKEEDLNSNNLNAASSKVGAKEKCSQKSEKEKKKEKIKVQQPEEENIQDAVKSEVQTKTEHENNKEKIRDPVSEEHAKRSIELASMGNRLAAAGQFEMAVSCFTDAIKYNPKEFKLFGNRSLCYERLQQYENALRDADLALSMQPKWIKGLFRKGKALCGLKRYYEATLIYNDVLKLERTSVEAAQELKRAQTLHLMEMGFTWAQSTEALKTYQTLEKAVDALMASNPDRDLEGACAQWEEGEQALAEEDDYEGDGQWTVLQTARSRTQKVRDLASLGEIRSKSQSPTPRSKYSSKHELFSVWVGTLGPTMTYAKLHELFSRVGMVCSIKMLLEQQCAFVNYTQKEECERAIKCINGMVIEGAPLTVRYPFKSSNGETEPFQRSSPYNKECFFWRTSGCTRDDCTFRHVPEHKNIDRDKFTSKLGLGSHAGNQK